LSYLNRFIGVLGCLFTEVKGNGYNGDLHEMVEESVFGEKDDEIY
jgi:hypothetical protein